LAYNPETGTTSEGESIDEALVNLKEATSLYLEEFPTGVSGHPLVTMFSVPAHAQIAAPFRAGRHQGTRGCVVPLHRTVKVGTLDGLLRQAQIDPQAFLDQL
jgi:hypothetical protein